MTFGRLYLVAGCSGTLKNLKLLLEVDQQVLKHPPVQPFKGSYLAILWLRKIQTRRIKRLRNTLSERHGAL